MISCDTIYHKPHQKQNVLEFVEFMSRYPNSMFFFANYEKAPWHIQCKFTTDMGYVVYVNFWPHKHKAMCEGHEVTFCFEEAMEQALELCNDKDDLLIDVDDVF